ncbi:WD repeat, SAM and U-box domain-containing protein 1 [Poecilia reticulata]|uniref:WD repeat, SAM and U-box domain-containing protein 1 n=1 Tax=Poecilia reticulata TaxID=8081 RepID=UPI0004A427DA|nr:PREDICTED: WD repeat, SAM and U-box domain-containing protein 1-like [Poecilia reticulata]XP_008402655.1 PREDICTED: WD repeat, SAM and U-box domain-containing protein 1-like [Poecilia reticulata]XP_008402657.1 PREDICTED: WD repeat, SAM and U-box domain-containing protein 1-like [Poecilia reticulata]XP_008402658.1 PREDICTED: WD repeat, SAM and U-box domain-containing protein 1-like [Poecilia reticulata]XP_008402659.1 PREDICTED: WD repeat, SAM and U-box domain-containing protein 1-like [Poecil
MASVVCTLRDHQDDINWCAFSAKLLATCSGDKTLRIYNAEDFSELPFSPLKGHGYSVHCCCFSPCGQLLVSCSTDATAVVWSTVTGDIEAVLEHPGRSPVRICALSPNAAHLVSGASDGTLALWDFHSKRLSRTGGVRDTTMVACSFSPCSQMFMTGSTYGDLRLWDLHLNQLLAKKDAHDLGVSCCSFAPIILSCNQVVQFRLASCGQDCHLKIWVINKFTYGGFDMVLLHTLTGQTAPVFCCAYSSDGQLLVSGSVDKSVKVYDANNAVLLHTLNHHERYVTACAFHPTSPLIATGSMDKTVNVCRLEDGRRGGKSSSPGKAVAGRSKLLVADWSEGDVSEWLVEEGLQGLVDKFKANNIDGTELLSLTKETLASELGIESVGLRGKLLRKVEELKSDSMSSGVPDEFLCPITRELMREPVIAADGYSYEREAIENWIHTKNRSSPMTNLPLLTTLLTPNHTLKMAISRWKTSQ